MVRKSFKPSLEALEHRLLLSGSPATITLPVYSGTPVQANQAVQVSSSGLLDQLHASQPLEVIGGLKGAFAATNTAAGYVFVAHAAVPGGTLGVVGRLHFSSPGALWSWASGTLTVLATNGDTISFRVPTAQVMHYPTTTLPGTMSTVLQVTGGTGYFAGVKNDGCALVVDFRQNTFQLQLNLTVGSTPVQMWRNGAPSGLLDGFLTAVYSPTSATLYVPRSAVQQGQSMYDSGFAALFGRGVHDILHDNPVMNIVSTVAGTALEIVCTAGIGASLGAFSVPATVAADMQELLLAAGLGPSVMA
jgi:hypothetical protein